MTDFIATEARALDPRFIAMVGETPQLERIVTGLRVGEGPVWVAAENRLVFSDVVHSREMAWSEVGGAVVLREPANKTNGHALDGQGRLIGCEGVTSQVVRTERDGTCTVLASHYDGRGLNGPNDVVVDAQGRIWFTDPTFARTNPYGGEVRPLELNFSGVFRIDTDGSLHLAADDFGEPNGLCFSRDEAILFVNDTAREHIRAFQVAADGALSGGEVWAEPHAPDIDDGGHPDGMKCDIDGNIWVTGPGGLHVFASDASPLGILRMPERTHNFAFGGPDGDQLFIGAFTSYYRLRLPRRLAL